MPLKWGLPRGFGELGRKAIYFQGHGEHSLNFEGLGSTVRMFNLFWASVGAGEGVAAQISLYLPFNSILLAENDC